MRPSRSTLDAAVAAPAEVDSPRVRLCVRALPAAVREAFPVLVELSTFAAARAARGLVILLFMCFVTFFKGNAYPARLLPSI